MLQRAILLSAAAAALSCSDPPQPVAKGAVQAQFGSTAGLSCPSDMSVNIKSGADGVTRQIARGLVEDGAGGASISCSVKRAGSVDEQGHSFAQYDVRVSAAQGQQSFSFSGTAVEYGDASIIPMAGSLRGTGVGAGVVYSRGNNVRSEGTNTCTLEVMEVASGRIHAGYACARLTDEGFAALGCSVLDHDRSAFAFLECGD